MNALWSHLATPVTFLFVLGVLIFVHELGHFLVARFYGVRVVTFSLGFGPKIVKFSRGATEYCVSAVPLGGYVKLAGETVQDDVSGAPDEFMSKSKWVRFQVYLAGPVMNIITALVITTFILARGADIELYSSAPAVIGSITPASPAEKAGLRVGDRIVSVDGKEIPTWDDLSIAILPRAGREVTLAVDRGTDHLSVRVTPATESKFEVGSLGVGPVLRPEIADVIPGTPAERAGFQKSDVIVQVDGRRGLDRQGVIDYISGAGSKPIVVTIERKGQPLELTVTPDGAAGSSRVGVSLHAYETKRVDPTFVQAIGLSFKHTWEQTVIIGQTVKGLFRRDIPMKQLMGPVGIAQLAGSAAQLGWLYVFELMAMLSLNLGLLNLLPVPVLDGGQIAILSLEGLFRRDMSVRVKERILLVGAALIVLLMVTVIYNDVARLLR